MPISLDIMDCLYIMGPSIPVFIYMNPTLHANMNGKVSTNKTLKKTYSCLFSFLRTAVNDIDDELTPEKCWLTN